jgi:hypothetical protein
LKGALKRGRSMAYLLHHWQHGELKRPQLRYWFLSAKLHLRRMLQPPPAPDQEGCPAWEMSYVAEMELCRSFLQERKRPRNYARHGLQKNFAGPTAAAGKTEEHRQSGEKADVLPV